MEIDLIIVEMFCDEALEFLSRWETIGLELAKNENKELYPELFRIAHNLKGGSRTVGLMAFGDFVHKIEDGITLLRDGDISLSENVVSGLLDAQKILTSWVEVLKLDPLFKYDVEAFLGVFEKVFSKKGSAPLDIPKKEVIENKSVNEPVVNHPISETSVLQKDNKSDKKKTVQQNESMRVSAHKLDELIQVIGELSIHQSIVWHTRDQGSSNNKMFLNSLQLGQKITKELYDKALSLRMQTIKSVFQRLERNIVDLSRAMNKDVHVQIEGGHVELDKSVLERIIDPLTHIVRNAIDHGIETKEQRELKGKTEKSLILISAKQDTFGVELVIKDNGKGIASEKILAKAKEKGLISNGAHLSQKEIFNLIFLPGFSTAEKVTDVSGRGVGMDVVRSAVEDLNGAIQIDSQEGLGTEFRITLPTSVSIIDAMLIGLGNQNYVVPIGSIEEVIYLPEAISSSTNMIEYKNQVLPIQDLEIILLGHRGRRNKSLKSEFKTILICKHKERRMGLAIDQVKGQQQVVIRPLNENINGAFGIMGGTILGNGEPGLIIDIPALNEYFMKESQTMERVA